MRGLLDSWFAARSARPGCGNLGPAPDFSVGVVRCGFAQVTAHQREAYLGNSHILAQPAEVFDWAQPQ